MRWASAAVALSAALQQLRPCHRPTAHGLSRSDPTIRQTSRPGHGARRHRLQVQLCDSRSLGQRRRAPPTRRQVRSSTRLGAVYSACRWPPSSLTESLPSQFTPAAGGLTTWGPCSAPPSTVSACPPSPRCVLGGACLLLLPQPACPTSAEPSAHLPSPPSFAARGERRVRNRAPLRRGGAGARPERPDQRDRPPQRQPAAAGESEREGSWDRGRLGGWIRVCSRRQMVRGRSITSAACPTLNSGAGRRAAGWLARGGAHGGGGKRAQRVHAAGARGPPAQRAARGRGQAARQPGPPARLRLAPGAAGTRCMPACLLACPCMP